MSFFSNLFKKFKKDDTESKKKKVNPCIKKDVNPGDIWEIVGELGDGAFGKVYKAKHRVNSNLSALKQVDVESDEDLEDFMVEIDILTDCGHKNIIQLYEGYLFNSKLMMYIEFCGAGALDSLMVDLEKPLTEPQIRFVCHEMVQALDFLHKNHVIHRDLKAGNVLLTMDAQVKLADFGVSAKNANEKQKRDSFIGTPYWMAPEVIACETFKDTPYDSKADIWSFGITLIELAEMHPPNHDMNPMRVMIKIHKSTPPTLDRPHEWSKVFSAFLSRCIVRNPEDRAPMHELMTDPFIKDVTENDRKPIRLLICEAKADVIETVEDSEIISNESAADTVSEDLEILEEVDEEYETSGEGVEESPGNISSKASTASLSENDQARTLVRKQSLEDVATAGKVRISDISDHEHTVIVSFDKEEEEPLEDVAVDDVKKFEVPEPAEAVVSFNKEEEKPLEDVAVDDVKKFEVSEPAEAVVVPVDKNEEKPLEDVAVDDVKKSKVSEPALTADIVSLEKEDDEKVDILPEMPNLDGIPSLDESKEELVGEDAASVPEGSVELVEEKTTPSTVSEEDADVTLDSKEIVDDIITDVIGSEEKTPSVSAVVLDTITDVSDEDDREAVVDRLLNDVINEVINSESDEPSVSAVVLDVMTDASEGRDSFLDPPKDDVTTPEPSPADVDDVMSAFDQAISEGIEGKDSTQNGADAVAKVETTEVKSPTDTETTVGLGIVSVDVRPIADADETSASKRQSMFQIARQLSGELEEDDGKEDAPSLRNTATGDAETLTEDTDEAVVQKRKKPERRKSCYKTMTRVRKFVVDGEEITTSTTKVVRDDEEEKKKTQAQFNDRKQELREMKLLSKQEARQNRELTSKFNAQIEQMEQKFKAEKQSHQRHFEQELETLERNQKSQLEKAEAAKENEIKQAIKRVKTDQVKEERVFREKLREELSALKSEVEANVAKEKRKEALRLRKEEVELEQAERLRAFREEQEKKMEEEVQVLRRQHRQKLADLDRECLRKKHDVKKNQEQKLAIMDGRQLQQRQQTQKCQLKELFVLKRQQTAYRQEQEVEQLRKDTQHDQDVLQTAQQADKKSHPKFQKTMHKQRMTMMRESLKLPSVQCTPEEEKAKLKDFEEAEKKRMRDDYLRMERRHKRKFEEWRQEKMNKEHELEQLQAEKKKALVDQETRKTRDLDEEFHHDFLTLNEALLQRKRELEEELAKELRQQSEFYSASDSGYNGEVRPAGSARMAVSGSLHSVNSVSTGVSLSEEERDASLGDNGTSVCTTDG